MPKTMNQYTQQFLAEQQPSSKFDEAAADLTSFLDFSSFDPAASAKGHDSNSNNLSVLEPSSATGSFDNNSFDYSVVRSPLRPVDDALLDSPLGLELSPADSIFTTSSVSGSPYDLEMSLGDFGDSSPLFGTLPYNDSPAVTGSDLVFPPFSHLAASSSSAGTPGMITTAELPSLFAALPLVAAHELADIKPIIPSSSSSTFAPPPPHPSLARHESTESVPFSFDDFIGDGAGSAPASAQSEEVSEQQTKEDQVKMSRSAAAAAKRKSVAEIKREAAAKVAEKEFSQDKHLGFRNTKKKMVDYDAPTLPKNYLTESATSKKRAGSTKVAQSVAKRSRTSASPALPATQPTPLDADQLDEEQLSQIELKRRQNTLAARKSRMRKAETFKMLSDEVEKLKQLNTALMAENQALKAKLGEQ
ncbi:hypothetical protein JCM5350_002647 [Sporobolomyces pararoseus]